MEQKKVLLTGGFGYIGSHTAISLLEKGYKVSVIDNLSNAKVNVKDSIERISGCKIDFFKGDAGNRNDIEKVFKTFGPFYAVIHFAGFKAVGESVENPLKYYLNNLESALETINSAIKHNTKRFIFSSSATVYGNTDKSPIDETFPLSATQPYGETKLIIEDMLRGIVRADNSFRVMLLRYFNPVGAHESGLIGEDPNGMANNLMPYITRVATGKLDHLTVFGNDYPTRDGTCVRDFIHVMDIAEGHTIALDKIDEIEENPVAINLGTGSGVSVKELVDTFNEITNGSCKTVYGERRKGDSAECYANVKKAEQLLGWKAKRSIKDMCLSAYNYEKTHV